MTIAIALSARAMTALGVMAERSYVRHVLCPRRYGFDLVSARGLIDRTLEIDFRKSGILGEMARRSLSTDNLRLHVEK